MILKDYHDLIESHKDYKLVRGIPTGLQDYKLKLAGLELLIDI